jgi:predicted anti-sigma-YlaC factor YlaD
MNCKSVQTYLSAYLDGELGGQESLRVREHLGGCVECRDEEQHLRSLKHILRGLPTYAPSAEFESRLVAHVMARPQSRSILSLRFNWRWAGGLVVATAIGAFLLIQATERRVPSAESIPMARGNRDSYDYARDQIFMAGNDPLSGSRFPIPISHDAK